MNNLIRITLMALLCQAGIAAGTDADLDTTFGSGGAVILCNLCPNGPPPPSGDYLTNILPSANGEQVMVGGISNETTNGPLVAFAVVSQTTVTTPVITSVHGQPTAAARDQAGRFIVAIGLTVMRFGSDFSLDTTFGTGGSVNVTFPGYSDPFGAGLSAVAIDHAQRIVVAGFASNASNNTDMAVARLLGTGAYDNTFGSSGRQMVGFDLIANGPDRAASVDIAGDNGLLLAGTAHNVDVRGGFDELALVRLQSNGALDGAFNTTGKRAIDLGGTLSFIPVAKFDHANRILVAATDRMMRLLANGQNDATFIGSAPTSTAGTAPVTFSLNTFAERSDGRVVLAGISAVSGGTNMTVARLLPTGGDDNQFNNGSNTNTMIPGASGQVAIILDGGRPLIGGNWYAAGFSLQRWYVARLQSDLIFTNRFEN